MPVAEFGDFTGSQASRRYHRASATDRRSLRVEIPKGMAPRNRVVSDSRQLVPISAKLGSFPLGIGRQNFNGSGRLPAQQFSQGLGFSSVTDWDDVL